MLSRYGSFAPVALTAALILIAAPVMSQSLSDTVAHEAMGTLVTTEWLSRHLDDPDLIVLDCSVRMEPNEKGGLRAMSGRTDYETGHIPSAAFADLMGSLCDPGSPLSFAMPTPEQFCSAMGALGVGDDCRVVLYDGFKSVWAARVWWMLRWVGFDRAAVLDGGLSAWTTEGRPLSTEPADRVARQLTPAPRPSLIADRDEVFAAINDEAVSLIDAMHEPHFHGKMALYGRPGHIPGARNVPATALVDESGCYRPHDELASMFDGDRKARTITYCGAGVAASSAAFVMVRLGFTDVAVYMASLQEWAADPANPLVVDKR
ncbi:MAG: sulfurtransferase [candidate division Zixibacteria bacterium]|nr:sulfurtransferase [candidate division Zixibacteria bacterium]